MNSGCTEQYVRDQVDHYYGLGVRHVFPVHNADNEFGGSALYNKIFDFNNKFVNDQYFSVTSTARKASSSI